ncbi:MAG: hypothetical protein ACK5Z5_01050 [Neisseriaceae bacterium]|jgi:hypothetical protein
MNSKFSWILLLLTPVFFIITHDIAYFAHEYAHSFSAWTFGFKTNPFALHYGSLNWNNLLNLSEVSENVDYKSVEQASRLKAAFIAFSGAGIGNCLLFTIAIIAINTKKPHSKIYYYFFSWLIVMNLGNFIDYIPIRTFASHGDIHEIIISLNISPWWIMIVLGYPIIYAVWYFYSTILCNVYVKMSFNKVEQSIFLILVTFTLFILFGTTGIRNYGSDPHLLSLLSIYFSPILVIACWPQRSWVCEKTKKSF